MPFSCHPLDRIALILVAALVVGCGTPSLSAIDPTSGPPRTLVTVQGDTFLSALAWDVGAAGQTVLPSGFLGAYFFSVPPEAALGAHPVALTRQGTSNSLSFDVTGDLPPGAPRLDRISVLGTEFTGSNIKTWLYVQGANVDVGAEVLIDAVVQPTLSHKALRNDLLGVAPKDLLYPIYHHVALVAATGERPAGGSIQVQLRNLDGKTSNSVSHVLPSDEASLDSDGDDLLDQWELNGYDADGNGSIDIDLAALGADRYRPDLFLEVDVMNSLANAPTAATFQAVQDAFAAAPVINPSMDNGIHLVIDSSGSVPFAQSTDLTTPSSPPVGFTGFYSLKAANFDNATRDRIYQYCIWANAHPNGWSGISDVRINSAGSDFDGPGDDCIVSFDDFPTAFQTVRSGAETLMHEFGHNLQQRHGGQNHKVNNPVYNSVMSYSWQLRSGRTAASRVLLPIYAPFYYQLSGIVEVGGALPAAPGTAVDYSQGMGRTLIETNLDEPTGLYNGNAIDWNQDGDATDTGVTADADRNGASNDTLQDFPNWSSLVFSGARQDGQYGN